MIVLCWNFPLRAFPDLFASAFNGTSPSPVGGATSASLAATAASPSVAAESTAKTSGDVWGDAFSNVTTSSKDKKDDAWSNAFFGNASGNKHYAYG